MAKTTRLVKSLYRLILPVFILLILATAAASIWLVYTAAKPPQTAYLVTPEKYGQFSARGSRVTEETWTNPDGTQSRGWLLRGFENAPAVILLHRYGADRSHLLDLGVKLNEATNFTVLMPDERGHGLNPLVRDTSFGGCEINDALSAINFLRVLKSHNQIALVGKNIGLYGVELGALTALAAAAKDESVKALALDSVPDDSDEILASATDKRFPFASFITSKFARLGTYFYFYDGCYNRSSVCSAAKTIKNRQILLLAGLDASDLQSSTTKLSRCFTGENKVETKTDLNPSGYGMTNASLEQSTAYDQRLIEFFKQNL